jgi:hypothetical protein
MISTSHRTGEPSVTGRSVGAALVLSSVFALIGWLFLRQSAAESALISAALGLATVSIYFARPGGAHIFGSSCGLRRRFSSLTMTKQ